MCAKKHLNIIRERCVVVVVVVCVGYAASAVKKAENSAFVSQRVYCMCVLMRRGWVQKGESGWVRGRKCRAQRVWVGTLFSTERSPLFSRACLPRHRSYQATLCGLNGLAGKAAPRYPPPTLFSPRTCLFFTASSSFSFSPQKHQRFFFSFCVLILAHSLLCPPCSQLFTSACHPSP